MKFLGLCLCDHDSSIAYADGTRVRFYKSERHTQVKHHGITNLFDWIFILKRWDVSLDDLDAVAIVLDAGRYPDLPAPDYEQIAERYAIDTAGFVGLKCPVFRIDHHYAHKLSIWPLSPDAEASDVDFVFDGLGDDERSHSLFRGDELLRMTRVRDFESIGRALSKLGDWAEMKGHPLDAAGKLMGLKSHGTIDSDFLSQISSLTIDDIKELFRFRRWAEHIGDRKKAKERWVDWLATIHHQCERIIPAYFEENCDPAELVTYSGGVAQNCAINAEIKKVVPNLLIPPHCPDDGLTLGCLEFLRREYQQEPFDRAGFPFWEDDVAPETEPGDATIDRVAEMLASGKIVGWYQGHGELGPRALGHRSILMDPTIPDGKDIINAKVKHREPYRPFGASVLEERVSGYFDWEDQTPFMLFVMDVLEPDRFPAITHVDGTCRPQTVPQEQEHFYRLIERFGEKTGVPLLLNTSLNNNGKPIAGKPEDAQQLLGDSEMDALVVGDEILMK